MHFGDTTHFSATLQPIATTNLNCDRQTAQTDLEEHITAQAQSIAPEFNPPTDTISAKIRRLRYEAVREGVLQGEYFLEQRQGFCKLKNFKIWLVEQGFYWRDVCQQIKLYETFSAFPLTQIGWVSLSALFQLCQPRYKDLVQQMRSIPVWIDTKVQELMQQWRKKRKAESPTVEPSEGGWMRVPGGGRAFKLPLLHSEEAGMQIVELQQGKNQTVVQVIKEAIALAHKHFLSVKQILAEYDPYAKSSKAVAKNCDVMRKYKQALAFATSET